MQYNVAIVGATGLVGTTMLKVLEEQNFPLGTLRLLASKKSAGTKVVAFGREHIVEELEEDSFKRMHFALFSAGGSISKVFAPIAAANGCIAIDNSSAWRMHQDAPLVVPEVNPAHLKRHKGIIANPNCSTIQMVVALKPLHDEFTIKRIVVSTYQSVSGAGQKGVDHLISEIKGEEPSARISSHPVAFNTVFHSISDNSLFSEEEIKMKNETRKILDDPSIKVAVTCVRIPVMGGHGESINIETAQPISASAIRDILENSPGVVVIDNPLLAEYPTPIQCHDKDEVFVGRIRNDDTVENGAHLWVVSDNLRKGAATNAVQIALKMIEDNVLDFENNGKWD